MTRGVVTLAFDDGYQAVFDHVLPLLRRYGMRAVFAVPFDTDRLQRTEGAPLAPFAEWVRACRRDGHELAAHGITHRALPPLSDTDLQEELRRAREATGAATLVYPGGGHDARVAAAARRYYRGARTVLPGFETFPPKDYYRLRSFAATRENFRVWKWNLRALGAALTNRWLIETYHNVLAVPTEANRHTVALPALAAHLKFLERLPVRIATIREVL